MKKTVLISILFLVSFSVFAQEKNDSVKTKSVKYLIDFSIHNLGRLGLYDAWQSDLSFGINFKRHTVLAGISGGPGLSFHNHYVNDNNISGRVDYLGYDPDYTKLVLGGANLSYQFQFNSVGGKSKSSVVFYSSFSRYRMILDNGYPSVYEIMAKNVVQCLIGYNYSRKTKSGFAFGFQVLAGIFYNVDTIDFPYRTPTPLHSELFKLFPTIMVKPTISYTF